MPVKHTKESFIKKAQSIYGDKYDYSLLNFTRTRDLLDFVCGVDGHGPFKKTGLSFLGNGGCPKCSKTARLNNESFLKRALNKHGDKYDYSKVEYINSKTKVIIICPEHGEFLQTPNDHFFGYGCAACVGLKKVTNEEFIQRAIAVHGDRFDYSETVLFSMEKSVNIICKIHGLFSQKPFVHLSGFGCSICSDCKKLTNETFIEKARNVHSDFYDYSLVEYDGAQSRIKIICPEHGIWKPLAYSHLDGKGCPSCQTSRGEVKVKGYLLSQGIAFSEQETFAKTDNPCLNPLTGRVLYFDFYLPSHNMCIEYDGQGHFAPVCWNGITQERANLIFGQTKYRDGVKDLYCKNTEINLLRIPYTSFDKIEEVISLFIGELNGAT